MGVSISTRETASTAARSSAAIDDENECMTVVIALHIEATRVGRVDKDSLATETDEDRDEGGVVVERWAGEGRDEIFASRCLMRTGGGFNMVAARWWEGATSSDSKELS